MGTGVCVNYVPQMFYSFFCDTVWVAIQAGEMPLEDAWIAYKPYHNDYERLTTDNAPYVFEKFKEKYEEILRAPKRVLPDYEAMALELL